MSRVDEAFKVRVYELVKSIPEGKLMTYGQVATLCGSPWAAWEVGQIAHYGPSNLPWHRVVNKKGGLAKGFTYGGMSGHKAALEQEGLRVAEDYTVELDKYLWNPKKS